MNKIEATAILAIIKTAYPAFYKNSEDINSAIDLWSMMFADDPAKIVTEAVKALMCTLKYPPTIADVKEKIALITQPESLSEMEAWNIVMAAIKNANYGAQASFDNFPPIIQKLVGSPGQLREWVMMESDVVNSVIQSNFMRSFKARSQSEKEYNLLPGSTKNLMEAAKTKMLEAGHEHD